MKNKMRVTKKVLYYYILIILALLSIQIFPLFKNIKDPIAAEMAFSIVSQVLIFGVLPILLLVSFSSSEARIFSTFKVDKGLSFKTLIFVIGFGVFAMYLANFLNTVFVIAMESLGFSKEPSKGEETYFLIDFLRNVILTCLFPALFEEITHRGMLLGYLSREYSVKKSIYLSSLFFSLMHMNMPQLLFTFILGYMIAIAVIATNSFWAGVVIHFLNNFIAVTSEHLNGAYNFDKNYQSFLDTSFGQIFNIIKMIAIGLFMILSVLKILKLYEKNGQNHELAINFANRKELKQLRKNNKFPMFLIKFSLILVNVLFMFLMYKE